MVHDWVRFPKVAQIKNIGKMSALEELAKPQYRVHFLDVKDADSIVIAYKENALKQWSIALIDAGNVSDSQTIKDFIWRHYNTHTIDLAVCSHPDRDHKGGFFNLLEDKEMKIVEFWWRNPFKVISDDDFTRMKRKDSKQEACEKAFNHPTDSSKNLLKIAREKCDTCKNAIVGTKHDTIPLTVLGPSTDFFRQAAIGIVQNFAELGPDPKLGKYDEAAETTENSARSIINEVGDESYTNMSSIVMMFQPKETFKILLAGDASCNSLREIYDRNTKLIKGCILKVPHHGSKHNLNTDLIDDIQPSCAIISASGNEKHPNRNLVYYLSKYCNVYSTHKSGELVYRSEGIQGEGATPLKKKIK